jgi:hypothetical protein
MMRASCWSNAPRATSDRYVGLTRSALLQTGMQHKTCGSLAQLVEQRTFNPLVPSSNLGRPTITRLETRPTHRSPRFNYVKTTRFTAASDYLKTRLETRPTHRSPRFNDVKTTRFTAASNCLKPGLETWPKHQKRCCQCASNPTASLVPIAGKLGLVSAW